MKTRIYSPIPLTHELKLSVRQSLFISIITLAGKLDITISALMKADKIHPLFVLDLASKARITESVRLWTTVTYH